MGIQVNGRPCLWIVVLFFVTTLTAAGADLRLVEAAERGDRDTVRTLIAQHVDVNTPQADGATALAWAAHRDDLETAELLIRAGANVNAANEYGVTPLALACANGKAAMVEKLLNAGADPNAALPTGETALRGPRGRAAWTPSDCCWRAVQTRTRRRTFGDRRR